MRAIFHRRQEKISRVLLRYLALFSLVFLLPAVLISSIVFHLVFGAYETSARESNLAALGHVQSLVDMKLREMNQIAMQYFLQSDLRSYALKHSPLSAIGLRRALYNHALSNSFLREIFLYTGPDALLLSSTGSYIPSTLRAIYPFQDWSVEALYEALATQTSVWYHRVAETSPMATEVTLPAATAARIVACLYPDIVYRSGAVLFFVDEASFLHLFGTNRGNVAAYAPDGSLIVANDLAQYDGLSEQVSGLPVWAGGSEAGALEWTVGGAPHILCYRQSPEMGWVYLSLLSTADALGDLLATRARFQLAVGLIFLLGTAVILVATYCTYQPIRALRTYAASQAEGALPATDEIDAVKRLIEQLHTHQDALRTQLSAHRPAVLAYALQRMLCGDAAMDEWLRAMGLSMGEGPYHVLLVRASGSAPPPWSEGTASLAAGIPRPMTLYCLDGHEARTLTLVLACGGAPLAPEAAAAMLGARIREIWALPCAVAAGGQAADSSALCRAYAEAAEALSHRFLRGEDAVLCFEALQPRDGQAAPPPYSRLRRLMECVEKGEEADVRCAVQTLMDDVASCASPLRARHLCMEILGDLRMLLLEQPLFASEAVQLDGESWLSCETLQAFQARLTALCFRLRRQRMEKQRSDEADLYRKVHAYVVERCCRLDFSAHQAADAFHMTVPAFSKYFKHNAGQTLTDFIRNEQLRRAQALLCETDLTVQDIALQTGQYDASNFIRKFKQHTGLTPGEYRARRRGPRTP